MDMNDMNEEDREDFDFVPSIFVFCIELYRNKNKEFNPIEN